MINEHETQKIHVDISMVDEKNNLDIKKLQKSNPEFEDVNFERFVSPTRKVFVDFEF